MKINKNEKLIETKSLLRKTPQVSQILIGLTSWAVASFTILRSYA